MTHKPPDSPGGRSVDEELNDPTRESMERLGHPDLAPEPDPAADAGNGEGDDDETPGQNSDWLPQ
jgi:hypothetical protein